MEFIANIKVIGRYTHSFIRNSESLDSQIASILSSIDFGDMDFDEGFIEELHWPRATIKLITEECGETDEIEIELPERKICKADLEINGKTTVIFDAHDSSLVDSYIKQVFLPQKIKKLKDTRYLLLSLYDTDKNCYFEGGGIDGVY